MSDSLQDQYATSANLSARIELHRRFTTAPVPWHEWVFERLSIPGGGRVLELGCGNGLFWRALADRLDPSWKLLLTDFSEGMVREAERITSSLPCRVDLAVEDAQSLSIADRWADIVVAKHMLYHVPDRDLALREIRRVLGPEGKLYASTIGNAYMRQLVELVAECVPGLPSFRDVVGEAFGETTGLERLRRRFDHVDVAVFEDVLHVTDPEAVVAYIRSVGTWAALSAEQLDAIAADVRGAIDREGALFVDSPAVLFTCHG